MPDRIKSLLCLGMIFMVDQEYWIFSDNNAVNYNHLLLCARTSPPAPFLCIIMQRVVWRVADAGYFPPAASFPLSYYAEGCMEVCMRY